MMELCFVVLYAVGVVAWVVVLALTTNENVFRIALIALLWPIAVYIACLFAAVEYFFETLKRLVDG